MFVSDCTRMPDEYPSTAMVKLWRTPGEIKMEVSDAGRGFDQEIQSKIASGVSVGVGLRGMQERVKQIGGTVGIHSNGKGASVLVTLPLIEEAVSSDESKTPLLGAAMPSDCKL